MPVTVTNTQSAIKGLSFATVFVDACDYVANWLVLEKYFYPAIQFHKLVRYG